MSSFSDLGFDEQIDWLSDRSDLIWSYDSLLEYAISLLRKYNIGFALYILNSIYNDDEEYYMWDASAGSTSKIQPILNENDAIDVYTTIFE